MIMSNLNKISVVCLTCNLIPLLIKYSNFQCRIFGTGLVILAMNGVLLNMLHDWVKLSPQQRVALSKMQRKILLTI